MSKKRQLTIREIWRDLSWWPKVVTSTSPAIVALYLAWGWLSGQVVWANEFKYQMQSIDCRFGRLERINLEGQAADTQFRIAASTPPRKVLTPEEARDLASLNVRMDSINRQLNTLGPECSSPNSVSPAPSAGIRR